MYKFKHSVKDKNNLVTHNIWSCGKYLNDLTGFQITGQSEGTLTIEQDGITATRSTTNSTYFYTSFELSIPSTAIGKDIIIKIICKATDSTVQSWLYKNNTWNNGGPVSINSGSWVEVIKTTPIPENTTAVSFRFVPLRTAGNYIAINNILVYIQ